MLLKSSFWSDDFWKPRPLLRESTISSHFSKSHSLAVKALSFWLRCLQLEACTLTTNHPPVQDKFPSHSSSLIAVVQVFSPDHLQQRWAAFACTQSKWFGYRCCPMPATTKKKTDRELMGRNRKGEVGDISQCWGFFCLFVSLFPTRVPWEGRW